MRRRPPPPTLSCPPRLLCRHCVCANHQEFKRHSGGAWIMKPIGKAQGKGIFLFQKLSQISDWRTDYRWKPDNPSVRRPTKQRRYNHLLHGGSSRNWVLLLCVRACCIVTLCTRRWSPMLCSATFRTLTWWAVARYLLLQPPALALCRYTTREGGVCVCVCVCWLTVVPLPQFDMRMYALVTSFQPLVVYLYRAGFARFSSTRYSNDSLTNTLVHLTNVAIQKGSDTYNEEVGLGVCVCVVCVWPHTKQQYTAALSLFERSESLTHTHTHTTHVPCCPPCPHTDWRQVGLACSQALPVQQVRCMVWICLLLLLLCHGVHPPCLWHRHGRARTDELFEEMQGIIVRSLQAVQKIMINDKHCFELYGYDLMFDEDLRPWLIEVNASPSVQSHHKRTCVCCWWQSIKCMLCLTHMRVYVCVCVWRACTLVLSLSLS